MSLSPATKARLKIILSLLGILVAIVGVTGWYRLFREVPQPLFDNPDDQFKYGSIAAENDAGLPYWVWVVLPRIFPEYLPGSGGYRSLGLPWEEGHELPVGFSMKTIGFPRVANNCAICHVSVYRTKPEETPHFVAAGPNHTFNVQGMIRFLSNCAADPKFNASTILGEIDQVYKLDFIDKLIYRYLIIPRVKTALLARKKQFEWMNRPHWPDWGPGRDDPMNLTKYFMTNVAVDDSVGTADFPAIWNLSIREGKNKLLNWDGATPSARSVLIDSALGIGSKPGPYFDDRMKWLEQYLKTKQAPKYPYPVNAELAASGKAVFYAQCNSCHGISEGTRMGTLIKPEEVGTDRNRIDTWTQHAADVANATVDKLGVHRIGLEKHEGYIAVPLDGIWLRAPYLHNGSVPNVRELLEPVENRSKLFYTGYDVYDPANLGFDVAGDEAKRVGWKLDTAEKGNGNQGHLYGTTNTPDEKNALIEYLKTL